MRALARDWGWLMAVLAFGWGSVWGAEWTAHQEGDKVTIKIDGELFAEYLAAPKLQPPLGPIVWPIIGPTGKPMTRSYPMADKEDEQEDHPHHRSLWFNHGKVNGYNFWGKQPIHHREFVRVEGGQRAVVETLNDWLAPDGSKVCEDRRRLTFHGDKNTRLIDFDITITASEGPVTFGDTKEGSFAIRVAETIKVDANLGGHIVNSHGQRDKDAWGKRAEWVDYYGPVDGQIVGIAVMNHPASFRAPTYWHVRTYGLFAANPFGWKDFGNSEDGTYTLPKGKSVSFYYRIVLHKGDHQEGRIAELYRAYAEEKK